MPLFVSEINLATVTLTEHVSAIFHDNRMLTERAFYCLLLKQTFLQSNPRIPRLLRAVSSVLCAFPSKGVQISFFSQ